MLHSALAAKRSAGTCPITVVTEASLADAVAQLSATARRWLEVTDYKATAGRIALVPGAAGNIERVLIGADAVRPDLFLAARLPAALPEGTYAFDPVPENADLQTLAFAMATYRFTQFKTIAKPKARLVIPKGVDGKRISAIAEAVGFGRELINNPAASMGPDALAAAALKLADAIGAEAKEIAGKKLLKKNFPMIHAVGRAASEEPRLIDFSWGDERHPKVTLVGKGVCFDTGGLDIKPASAMELMKKDMGGAATALTAAWMIAQARVPVRLRVLVPIVENAISASAFRPGDVLTSRKGLTVEIGNTDAEGRLILADALALADEEAPELILDFATLTGAARVALGPDLPPFYTEDDAVAEAILSAGRAVNDPVWRLPLWAPYNSIFASRVADLNNSGTGGMAGSITAALFLRRFVEKAAHHIHFDIYGWSLSDANGLPAGGNPQVARLVLAFLEQRYGG
ncbi:MAG: leucyl aminopeptidase family protein [Proteobacteria bacterium]|nr:leucyl aminopeptidase family protein [Pseudomonadota bacterium]